MPGVAERREDPVLGLVHEDVAVGQIENLRPSIFPGSIPAGVPQLPANLKGDGRLPGAGRHREELAMPTLEDALDGAVNGDLLVVAFALADGVVHRREEALGARVC